MEQSRAPTGRSAHICTNRDTGMHTHTYVHNAIPTTDDHTRWRDPHPPCWAPECHFIPGITVHVSESMWHKLSLQQISF